jgi:WD40 repeat protein
MRAATPGARSGRLLFRSNADTCWNAVHESSDVTAVRFSADDEAVAVGCFNGNIYVRSTLDSCLSRRIQPLRRTSPVTSLRWHPSLAKAIVAASASGSVTCWHTESGQNLWTVAEPGNSINSIDLSPKGTHFATVGADCVVRYYSLSNRRKVLELASKIYSQGTVTGHGSRIFAAAFMNDNIIASSGWDDTVLLWDIRGAQMVRALFGTHICGESLCFTNQGRTMVTGSWRDKDQLQFWDTGSGKVIESLSIGKPDGTESLQIYSLGLSRDGKYLAASGSGMNCVLFYRLQDRRCVASTNSHVSGVNCVHIGARRFAYGLANSELYVDKFPW